MKPPMAAPWMPRLVTSCPPRNRPGTGVRTCTFAVENLPETFKVVYTTDGYWIANPALGTTIIIR